MSIADKIARLNTAKTNIATAITNKGGTVSAGDGFEDFANDIATIPTGSGGSGWQRPVEWGEYPLEFQQEKAKPNAERTMEAIYLLYHYDEDKYGEFASFASFRASAIGGYKVERGHMVGSTFTVDATTSVASGGMYSEDFTSSMPEYILYRITPTTSGNRFTWFSFAHADISKSGIPQIILEVYGRLNLDMMQYMKTRLPIHYDIIGYGTYTTLSSIFYNCNRLQCVECEGWNTSQVTTLSSIFNGCSSLQWVDCADWDVSSVKNFSSMYTRVFNENCFNISSWNMSSATNLQQMFDNAGWFALDLSDWNVSSVTNMSKMFQGSGTLSLNLSGWDVSSVTDMSGMFYTSALISTLDCTGWDTSSLTTTTNMFAGTTMLVDFISPKFYISVSFSACTKLSHDSLMSIINNLATVSTAQTLTLGSTNLAKLTAEEIAIATEKGWTVA